MNNLIKEILYMFIAVLFGILAVRFVIWLLPIILVFMISHYIYRLIKSHRPKQKQKTVKKTIKIIDMVEED